MISFKGMAVNNVVSQVERMEDVMGWIFKFFIALALGAISLLFLNCVGNGVELEAARKKLDVSNKELESAKIEKAKLSARVSEIEKELESAKIENAKLSARVSEMEKEISRLSLMPS